MNRLEANDLSPLPAAMPEAAVDEDEVVIRRWVADFQRGRDREASFRRIFERFHRPVEGFFARRGVAPEDRLDLTQEVFLNLYRGLDRWRPEARFGTWVFRIATTVFLKHRRAHATAKRSGSEVSPDSVEAATRWAAEAEQLDDVLVAERRQAVVGAMAELPERMRHCLLLRVDHGLKYREIAHLMQVSIQTVKAHLFQARGRLADRLEGSWSEEVGG
ncbi:MAG: sigma-70 family RNA polymerase sigma factor [Acidobacteria bacterium]|nr:sigma-70 family RNA polymerase sigma factor [Acidobacteriota bacterium]